MGRLEAPIVTNNKALGDLAEWLRQQRRRAGSPSYRTLASRAGFHATTLQRAASGKNVPRLPVVLAYACSCDAPPEKAKTLWKRARHEATRATRAGHGLAAPSPKLVRDFADLSAALRGLYEKEGSPPLRTMEKRAGAFGALPRSTAHRIVNKQTVPQGLLQFRAFLRACEVPESEQPDWEAAWGRAWRHARQDSNLGQDEFSWWATHLDLAIPGTEEDRGRLERLWAFEDMHAATKIAARTADRMRSSPPVQAGRAEVQPPSPWRPEQAPVLGKPRSSRELRRLITLGRTPTG